MKIYKTIACIVFFIFWFKMTYLYYHSSSLILNEIFEPKSKFNFSSDLLVFIHIEKTGGTLFQDKFVQNLTIFDKKQNKTKAACRLRPKNKYYYNCFRDEKITNLSSIDANWILMRRTVGWLCGVHSDYTKIKACVEKKKIEKKFIKNVHFITILRDPTLRYISEWLHMARSMKKGYINIPVFNETHNVCNQEVVLSKCIPGLELDDDLTLEKFLKCENNLAENRQTRLLADYSETQENCSLFRKNSKKELLENAIKVLESLSFFALNEYEDLSLKLFEKQFNNFKFNVTIKQDKYKTLTLNYMKTLNKEVIEKIDKANHLDWKLYEYAKLLFFERIKFYGISTNLNNIP